MSGPEWWVTFLAGAVAVPAAGLMFLGLVRVVAGTDGLLEFVEAVCRRTLDRCDDRRWKWLRSSGRATLHLVDPASGDVRREWRHG